MVRDLYHVAQQDEDQIEMGMRLIIDAMKATVNIEWMLRDRLMASLDPEGCGMSV